MLLLVPFVVLRNSVVMNLLDLSQVSRLPSRETIQWQYSDSVGFVETTLFHRQRRQHVQTHTEFHAKLQAPNTGKFRRS